MGLQRVGYDWATFTFTFIYLFGTSGKDHFSSFPHSQSIPSGSFHKPLILIHQRADRMKTTVTENYPNWSHGSQSGLTQRNCEPCHVGPPKMDGSWWRVLSKHGPLEKGLPNQFSILALRSHEQYEKAKTYDTERWTLQVSRRPKCYWKRVEK